MSLSKRVAILGSLLVLGLGCGGTRVTGDRVDTVNQTLLLTPSAPVLVQGQSLQFQAATPWGSQAVWAVEPAGAGTVTASGLFTAGSTSGACTVLAVWSQDVRYTATAAVLVITPPSSAQDTATASISPNYVNAFGAQQGAGTGASAWANGAVVGEAEASTLSTSASGGYQNRAGFLPPGAN